MHEISIPSKALLLLLLLVELWSEGILKGVWLPHTHKPLLLSQFYLRSLDRLRSSKTLALLLLFDFETGYYGYIIYFGSFPSSGSPRFVSNRIFLVVERSNIRNTPKFRRPILLVRPYNLRIALEV